MPVEPVAPQATRSEAPAAAIVTCTGLRRSYGPVAAVDGLDLEVRRGELLAVLGPSGCGKTTLLRLMAGFERPDAGTITIEGTTVAGPGTFVPPERRRVGIVVQDHALFPHLTVAANVAYGLSTSRKAPHRGERRHARVADVLAMVGLETLGERYPAELSGGQQQRVAIARALAPEPGVVLLDEPFANLDAALRARIRFEVRAILKAAGATVVLVTHDQEEALSLADRVAVVHQGRVLQVGPPDDVYRRPATPFVARFVGDADLLPGTSDGAVVATPLGSLTVDGPVPAPGPALAVVRPESVRLSALGPHRPERRDGPDGPDEAGPTGPAPETAPLTGTELPPGGPDLPKPERPAGADAAVPDRPEQPDGAGGADGAGAATVASVTYYGHDQLVEVALDAGTLVRARLGTERLFQAGERVRAEIAGPVIAYPAADLP